MELELTLNGVTVRVTLLETAAPRTTKALWDAMPITDRVVQVKWSGDAWRTEGDYDIGISEVENEGHVLVAGDLIYYPRKKIGLAYGRAEWRNPDLSFALHVSDPRAQFARRWDSGRAGPAAAPLTGAGRDLLCTAQSQRTGASAAPSSTITRNRRTTANAPVRGHCSSCS